MPEQIAVLVRRQRHLAARMPAGPWWRLVLTVGRSAGTEAGMTTDYDYGDHPFPSEDLLAPEHYRNDLAAYPRTSTPAWLAAYVADADGKDSATRAVPQATARVTTRPAGPGGGAAERPAAPGPVPVLDTRIGRKRLYADPQVIIYGKKTIALDQAEWVGYSATHTATKRFLYPTTHDSTWDFAVGRYPYYGGPVVRVSFYQAGRRAEQPEEWSFLVHLAMQYLQPRLLTELVARVRRHETVTVGGSLKINQTGITCAKPRLALPWESIAAPQLQNGAIFIYQTGAQTPVLTVPLSHPNAGLIPDLFAALGP